MKTILEAKDLTFSDLKSFCKNLSSLVKDPYLFFLEGDLAAGKTSFVRAWVQNQIDNESIVRQPENLVSSPTFTLHQEYQIKQKKIHHFDLYRLRSEEELEATGFWDFFNQNDSIIIEWPDRISWENILTKKNIYRLQFRFLNSTRRSISVVQI